MPAQSANSIDSLLTAATIALPMSASSSDSCSSGQNGQCDFTGRVVRARSGTGSSTSSQVSVGSSKRTKVSRACDECRRKKVSYSPYLIFFTSAAFRAMD